MDTAGRGLTGEGAGDVACCGAVLVGPDGGGEASLWDWSARLLVGAAFRHLCATRAAEWSATMSLLAFVRRPAGAILADLAASPDDGARGAAAALGSLAGSERALAGVVARAVDLLDRAASGGVSGAVPGAAAVPRLPGARAARPRPRRRRG